MIKTVLLIILLSIIAFGCHHSRESQKRDFLISENKMVYWDEQELTDLSDFVEQNPKIMLAFFEADCSACIIGVNDWLKFQKNHPDVTLLLIANTKQSDKYFWALLTDYYEEKFYVVFDRQHKLFRENHFRYETAIIDSAGTVFFEHSIHDAGFEKEYKANL